MTPLPLTAVFDDLRDPRRDTRNKLHRLTDILTIATCAIIAGAESWEAIAEYGRTKVDVFRRSLPLDNGIPSRDTFERVSAKLAPGAFGRWMAAACEATGLMPIAIDGKSARRAKRDTATGCLTAVIAWATENRLTLGQVAVPDGSNEIGTITELLRTLDLAGAIVTIDVAGCQVANSEIIRGRGGHYLLAVKDNQPTLRAAVERVVGAACEVDFIGVAMDGDKATDDAHGRHEERYVTVIGDLESIPADWPDVAAVVMVDREREVGGKRTVTTHYYLTSYAGTAAEIGRWVRGHWGISIPRRKTREATTCASPDGPVTIAADALLALAAWCDPRQGQGVDPGSRENPTVSPPAPGPPVGPTGRGPGSTPVGSPAQAPAPPRRPARQVRDHRAGSDAGGPS